MTESTVSSAVAVVDNGPQGLIQKYRSDFATVLPSHIKPEQWVRLAQGALRRDASLMRAATNDPGSLLAVLLDAARLGLEPGTEQYYLVPFKGKVQGLRGYQGEIELIYRAGAASSVIVEVVKESDYFEYSPGEHERPIHRIDWKLEDRGALCLVYAYAVMKDGATSKVVVLNRADVNRAKSMSQSAKSDTSPWKQHEEAMWLKTAAHRLAKWVPTSAEYMRERLRLASEVAAEPAVSASVPLPQPRPASAADHIEYAEACAHEAEFDPECAGCRAHQAAEDRRLAAES
jgi:recombination protein RecT